MIVAKDGQEALDMMKASAPDLLISDIMMPEIDGLTLAQRNQGRSDFEVDPCRAAHGADQIAISLLKGWESGAD